MRDLTYKENQQVSAAYASMSSSGKSLVFETTGTSVNRWMTTINGIYIDLAFYADHIDDRKNNVIFSGTSGSFCYNGNKYTVSPIDDGSRVVVNAGC